MKLTSHELIRAADAIDGLRPGLQAPTRDLQTLQWASELLREAAGAVTALDRIAALSDTDPMRDVKFIAAQALKHQEKKHD